METIDGTAPRPREIDDLDRLWATEFGDRREVGLRVGAIALSGLGLWAYTGTLLGPVWAVFYIAALSASYLALRPEGPGERQPWLVGVGSFLVTAAAYVSLPLYLLTSDDIVLVFCGAFGLICLAVFTLFRDAPPRVIHVWDIAMGWVFVGVAALRFIPMAGSPAAKAVMALLSVVAGVYYTIALISTRRAAARLRAEAQRAVETEKMDAIGRLSGGIAHDFNNILTVLQGSLELYHEMPEGPDRDAMVQEAQRAGSRATGLVAQLLAYARRAPLDARPVDVAEVLDELTALGRRLLPDRVVFEVRRPAASGARVLADREGLRTAATNLLVNARDAVGAQGTVTLAAEITRGPAMEADHGPADDLRAAHLCLWVADDGPGMTADMAERAVEPFFTTKPPGSGSGLGLPMAKGFAEQSGGALTIRSSTGGTIVALHLPLAP